ncbi:MAG: hypothetical protein ACK47B_12675 [Armatimonadota bacterium]
MSEEFAIEVNSRSAHVRYPSRVAVVEALVRLQVGQGVPVPVWPPRRLPHGLLISEVRDGWVSLWSPLEDMEEWLPRLTETLECAGVLIEVVQSRFWICELFRDGQLLGRVELPTTAIEWDLLQSQVEASLVAEGVAEPWRDEARFGARADEIARSEEYQEDIRRLQEERPRPEELRPFLPPHASLEQAWELLFQVDREEAPDAGEEAESPYAEDYADAFASYLGIRDATWDPRADADALSEGEYEDEEGLPEGWRDFVVLPITQLRVL